MLNIFDSHSHSDNSPDGHHSVTYLCEQAVDKGLMGLCITDHCDIDIYKRDNFELRMINSNFEVRKAQLFFGDRLMLTAGIELGQPLFDPALAERALGLLNYDFVLGSVHVTRGWPDYYEVSYKGRPLEEVNAAMDAYFGEVLETAKKADFDSLAHLTYPIRYISGRDGIEVDLRRWDDLIDEILRTLIARGKGLELNVAGLHNGWGQLCPPKEIFARYRELGGEIVTLGSDSHLAQDLGVGIAEGMEVLQSCGFQYFAFYKKRQARMLGIR